ncbi:nucleotidyltransferase domain-containing protein [bacterium]|nr:nucleotidyltransferase domain-containing protein [bacterium]
MNLKKKIIKRVCKEYADIQAIYLFGSFATEDQTDQSDVDIALLFDSN